MIKRKTIYFADDDYEDRLMLKDAIRTVDPHIDIIEAEDGVALLKIFQDTIPPFESLIILDMNMPKMNGLETLAEIRNIPFLSTIPAVLVSTSDNLEMIGSARQLGAVECFAKPYSLDGFLGLARQLVSVIRQQTSR